MDRNTETSGYSDLKIMPMISLHLPNMGRMAISDWAAMAASQIMTFGFNDIDARFALSRKYFTHNGWETFRKAMLQSKLCRQMTDTQQIVTSVPASPPVLKQEGLINGKDGWVFDVPPLLVTFPAPAVKESRPKMVHMVIQNADQGESRTGWGSTIGIFKKSCVFYQVQAMGNEKGWVSLPVAQTASPGGRASRKDRDETSASELVDSGAAVRSHFCGLCSGLG